MIILFRSFFEIGLFAFGGGYSVMSLINEILVNRENLIDTMSFLDIISLSQMTPGPIAINAATLIGSKTNSFLGALLASVSVILPSIIFISIINLVIKKKGDTLIVKRLIFSIRPAALGMVFAATYSLMRASVSNSLQVLLFVFSFLLTYFYKIHILVIVVMTSIISYILF